MESCMHAGHMCKLPSWCVWRYAGEVSVWGHSGQSRVGLAWGPLPAESGVALGTALRRLEVCVAALVMLGGEVTPQQAFGDSMPLQCTHAMSTAIFLRRKLLQTSKSCVGNHSTSKL